MSSRQLRPAPWIATVAGAVAAALSTLIGASLAEPIIYTVDRTPASTIHDRDPTYVPTYLVYADGQRTPDEAQQLLGALGLPQHLESFKGRAFVIAPSNGTKYEEAADLEAFQNFLRTHRSSNLKIVAIGAGATFVNNVIGPHAFAVAGIMTYGGAVDAGRTSSMPVPVYVHSQDAAVGRMFVSANGATARRDFGQYTEYTNPSNGKQLQRVAISKRDDLHESAAQAFQHAWESVFSRNYRLYMRLAESYSQGFDPNNYPEPWELEPYVMFDELGIRYEAVTEDLPGLGPTLRYEYVPRKALVAASKSVPLVIMLHGNNNDPRTQGESSGWVEIAGRDTLILSSIEWQGRKAREGTTFAAIGEAGTMALLDRLLAKYPQIDPARVYLTGLSAGAMNSFVYGLNNADRIAGVAGASAPFGPPALLDAAQKASVRGLRLPMYAIAGTRDMYKPLPVNDTSRSFYTVIRAFASLDDIKVPETPDLSANELFGVALDGQRWGELAGTRAMIGTLGGEGGVMIRLVALDPYGHWNFKPAATDMWTFLSRFSRNTTTGRLVTRAVR